MENKINKSEIKSYLYAIVITAIGTALGILVPLFFDIFGIKQLFGRVFFVLSFLSFLTIVGSFIKPVRDKFFHGITWTEMLRKSNVIRFMFGFLLSFCYCLFIAEKGYNSFWYFWYSCQPADMSWDLRKVEILWRGFSCTSGSLSSL